MWNITSTTSLLKEMSQTSDPVELLRLFFNHLRNSVDVHRALVLSNAGLSAPEYRLIHDINCSDDAPCAVPPINPIRRGGILATIFYQGAFQNISDYVPDPADPGFDLLQGSGSLVALPLFEQGTVSGMVVLLGSSPRSHDTADLCALAMVSSSIGRAIESQKLARQLEESCRALDAELQAAANVQRWLLPTLPSLDDVGVAASYRTARHSGGDYYDVGRLPDGRLGILIADVSGKGAAAAVLMAVLRSIVHDEIDRAQISGPASLLDYADSRLRALHLSERGAFVTAFCAAFDSTTGTLTYSCAGHEPARLLRAKERVVIALDGARSIPLGIFDEPGRHSEESAILMPGDLALFFTDGITEARSPDGEFFGADRLDQLLRSLPDPLTPDAAVQSISKAVVAFEGDATQADDQTMLALKRGSSDPTRHRRTEHLISERSSRQMT